VKGLTGDPVPAWVVVVIERQLALIYPVRASFNRFWRVIAHITGSARSSATVAATFLPAPTDSL
jgi:hypothetical protein